LSHPHPFVEDSDSDLVWRAMDRDGGHHGEKLLGLALMRASATS